MAEVEFRDPTIKLFGKTIPLSLNHVPASADYDDDSKRRDTQKENSREELGSEKQGDGNSNQITTDQSTSGISENENPSLERETLSPKASKNEEESETSNSQDKTQKKPDKILPCPRCNSMDTKFCYYNNYNVNQPRYFCKNCQRYWTAGGAMRNVPVGAGRRKNKNSSSSHFHHLMVPENGLLSHHYMGNNATFLTFGSDSVPSVSQNCHLNGDDHSNKCSNSSEKGGKISLQQQAMKSFMPFPPQLPSFPGLPWPAYSCTPPMIPSVVCPPGFPVSYIPAVPFWGCTVPLPSLNNQNGQDQFTGSSVLGKHSRDGKIIRNSEVSQHEGIVKQKSSEIETEKCVLIPKTLRVDDPKEAAKSSIWCKLGLQTEKTTSINGSRGLFAAFQSKEKEANNMENCLPLEANPAALSRALKFREIA